MSGERNRSISESLVLDDTTGGVVIKGITDDKIAEKSGLQAGDEIVAATIHLDHLNKNQVLNILKVLEPYDDNMRVLTKKELNSSAGLGSLDMDLKSPSEMFGLKKDLSLDTKAKAPDVSLNGLGGDINLDGNLKAGQGLGGGITGPTLNGDLPSFGLSKPSADTGAFGLPIFGLTGPDVKGDLDGSLKAPDVRVSTPEFNTPSIGINKPEINAPDVRVSTPEFNTPSFGINKPEINAPDVKVSKPEFNTPSFGINKPEINAPDVKVSTPEFNTPSFGINKPEINAPDVRVSKPEFNTPSFGINKPEINAPDVRVSKPEFNTPSIDIDKPEIKTGGAKFNPPKFSMPTFGGPNIESPSADANISGLKDLKAPNLSVSGTELNPQLDLKTSDVKLETPKVDVDAHLSKKKWPHETWKGPKIKGLKADVNTPKIDGNLNASDVDVNLPKADIAGPKVDVRSPDIEAETSSDKWGWLPWNWSWNKSKIDTPKADLNIDANKPDLNLSAPKIDGEINGPDFSLPKGELKGPGIDVNGPDVDPPSIKSKWPHKGWKKPVFHGPKADLNPPDLKLQGPDAEVSLPKGDLDVNLPDANIEPPSGRKFPTLKKPKFMLSKPKVETPDVDLEAKSTDLSLSTPTLDVKAPNADIETPSGKVKFPTLKKPKWSLFGHGPDADIDADVPSPDLSLKTPKVDADLKAPDANVDINGPDVDGPSGFFKGLKLPKIGTLKGPKANIDADVDAPKIDLDSKLPNASLSGPKIDGGIGTGDLDVSLPSTNLSGPNVDVNGPDVDGPSGFFKGLKLPKIGTLKGPKANIDADVDAPKIDLDSKLPNASLSGPKIDGGIGTRDLDVSLPSTNLSGPNVDVNGPDVNLEAPDSTFKLSRLKLPKFKGPKVKGPDVDANFNAADINYDMPKADVETPDLSLAPKIKGGLDTPDFNVSGNKPGFKLPSFNIGGSKPKLPDADLKGPDVSLPDADIKLPTADVKAPDWNLDTNLKNPEAKLSLQNADINLPKAEVKAPDAQLKTPSVDLESKRGDFKFPTFKLPKFGSSDPKVEVPSVKSGIDPPGVNVAAPTVDLSGPKVVADIESPNVDLKAPKIDANVEKPKLPHFSFPKLNLSGKNPEVDVSPDLKVKAPSIDGGISTPGVSLSGPEVNTNINKPNLGISADADADIKESPKSRLKSLFKWGRKPSSDDEGLNVRSEVDAPKADSDDLAFKFHKLPTASIDASGESDSGIGLPKLDTEAKNYVMSKGVRLPIINNTSKSGEKVDIFERLRMAKEKVPSANASPTDSRDAIDLKLPSTSLGVNASADGADSSLVRGGTFKIEKPDSVLDVTAPTISTSDDNDKMSLSLSNMLGLNI